MSVKKQSALVAQLAEQYHKEVIIRLPLEPAGKIPSDFTGPVIMVHYTKEAIQTIIAEASRKSRIFPDSTISGGPARSRIPA